METIRHLIHSYPIDLNDEKVLVEPISRTNIQGKDFFLLNHADYIQHLFRNANDNYQKADDFYDALRTMVGRGVLTSEGPMWKRQRQSLQPAFGRQSLDEAFKKISDITLRYVNSLETVIGENHELDIHHGLMLLTAKITAEAFFSTELTTEQAEKILESEKIGGLLAARIARMPDNEKTSENYTYSQYEKARNISNDFAYTLLENRRKNPGTYNDALTLLLNSQKQNPEITDVELRDQIITILSAGHETCANTLTWAFYLLSQHSDIQTHTREEIKNTVGERDFQLQDFENLAWPQMIFKEGLRMFPPVYILSRSPVKEDVIGGIKIPAQSVVSVSPWVTHRNEKYWKNPFSFDPQRFSGKPNFGFMYFPFGGGTRICLGQGFAMREGPVILAAFLRRYQIEFSGKRSVQAYGEITLRPRHPFNLKLTKVD